MRHALLSALLILVGGYLVIAALMWTLQSRMLYFPSRTMIATPAAMGLPFEEVSFRATDGVSLHGWYIPAPESRGTVLFFHGNGGNISGWFPVAEPFRRAGFDTFLIDYRGYGQSEGTPSEQGTYHDAEGAWQYLTEERGIAPDRIVIAGRSLGGAVAAWLAERHTPRALVLESTFTSVPDLASELYPWLPVRLLARFRYNTAARLPSVRSPVLILHSRADEIIPFHHSQRLWQAATEPKAFVEIQGAHNEGYTLSEREYAAALRSFLDTHAPADR